MRPILSLALLVAAAPALALASSTLAVTVLGWHFLGAPAYPKPAPRQALPPGLKLDYRLDLTRTGGASRSSPPDPAPSR